jgi:hypothetical protein
MWIVPVRCWLLGTLVRAFPSDSWAVPPVGYAILPRVWYHWCSLPALRCLFVGITGIPALRCLFVGGGGGVLSHSCIRVSLAPFLLLQSRMEHPMLAESLQPHLALEAKVRDKALLRLKYDNLEKCEELVSAGSPWLGKPAEYAMNRYAYYRCFKCKVCSACTTPVWT